jgi:ribosomal protein S18 acetylase RimI-like enzyme
MFAPAAFSFRRAAEVDLPSLIRCDLYALELRRMVEQQFCILAAAGSQPLGFAVLEYTFFGQGFIPFVCVASEHQGKGVGLSLLLELESRCSTSKLFTSTNASNGQAQRLVVRAGFTRSGTVENLDDGDPEFIYFKAVCHSSQAANPSVKGTSCGKPQAAPYVER